MSGAPAVDHLVVLVRDLDAAAARWERLGFTVTPRGLHSAHMGTANHCVMFGADYLELLGVVHPTEGNAPWRAALEAREGLGSIALATDDAAATVEALAAHGLSAGPPLSFARPVDGPGGVRDAAFVVARATGFAALGLDLFFCQHKTRDVVWRRDWQTHANGAMGLAGLSAVAPDPAAHRAPLEAVFGADAVRSDGEGVVVATGSIIVTIAPGPKAELRGFAVWVTDLDRTAEALENGAVAHAHRPRSIEVGPAEANGVALSFVE